MLAHRSKSLPAPAGVFAPNHPNVARNCFAVSEPLGITQEHFGGQCVTMDEGGGYYDSGYIQPLDFFGDGPRTPLIVVSPFTRGGHISHTYSDHVSILKFMERNWDLKPLTHRSRDNFPNPIADDDDPYVPLNSPAIGDLFDFGHRDGGDDR